MTRVLVVDDDENSRELLKALFESHRYSVEVKANGAQALESARRDPPDMIVSDILMPVMDGFTLCREIKSDERLAVIAVVFYTATYIESEDERLARRLGASEFITKPTAPREFMARVERVVEALQTRTLTIPERPSGSAGEIEQQYSGVLGRKLEKKVAELKRERLTLRESEARYRTIIDDVLDNSTIGIFIADKDLRLIWLNHAAETFFSIRRDELIGHELFAVATRALKDRVTEPAGFVDELRTSYRNRSHIDSMEVRQTSQAGEPERWLHYSSQPIRSGLYAGGLIEHYADITSQKRSAAELNQLNQHVRLLLESTAEGLYGVDRQGRCTFINHSGAQMLQYASEELIDRNIHEVVHRAQSDDSAHPFEESPVYDALNEGQGCFIEHDTWRRRDGQSFDAEYSAHPIMENDECAGAVVVFRDVTETRALAQQLSHQASHDALTGLINRWEFNRRLERAVAEVHGTDSEHALLFLDLDQFKIVNDTCGHMAGDELLRQLSSILGAKLRRGDTLARLGGDEFGVLLEYCPREQALNVAGELRKAVREHHFVWDRSTHTVGVSIGMVAITDEAKNVSQLQSAADAACYAAKESGRNRVHVYEVNDEELARRHMEMRWVGKINDAVSENRLGLMYQTIKTLAPDGIAGEHYEILLRIYDENNKVIGPAEFLPAAEHYDLMPTLDRWVVSTLLAWFAEHPGELEGLGMCAVNLSALSITDEHFLQYVRQQFSESPVPPNKICFEITETAVIANLTKAIRFINELKEIGCLFALDDFGIGMSSFAYLKRLPVDALKIDGTFVKDILHDEINLAMVKAINEIGHVMGKRTIAEFVEDEEVLVTLREIGVDYAQGFAIAIPKPLMQRAPRSM